MNNVFNIASGVRLLSMTRSPYIAVMLVMAALLSPTLAHAQYCTANPAFPGTEVITAMPATVNPRPSDRPGTAYFTLTANQPGYTYARCGRSHDTIQFGRLTSAESDGYWASGVSGLGWRLRRGSAAMTATISRTIGPGNIASTNTAWSLSLVRTAATLGTGIITRPSVRGSFETGPSLRGIYWSWSFTGDIRVALPTCSISGTGTTLTIGRRVTSELPVVGAVSTTSPSANVQLSCVNAPRVDMRLTTVPIPGTPNVLPLTGAVGGRAAGVGVQLIYANSVLAYNTAYRVSNAAPGTLSIPLAARYYRTGALTPGTANSSAVVQFTYP